MDEEMSAAEIAVELAKENERLAILLLAKRLQAENKGFDEFIKILEEQK